MERRINHEVHVTISESHAKVREDEVRNGQLNLVVKVRIDVGSSSQKLRMEGSTGGR